MDAKSAGLGPVTCLRTFRMMKITVFWVVAPCSPVEVYQHFRGTCCLHHQGDETLVNLYQTTRHYNPEDSHLHTHRRENLKSYFPDDIHEIK
jgi:hypothetical protein